MPSKPEPASQALEPLSTSQKHVAQQILQAHQELKGREVACDVKIGELFVAEFFGGSLDQWHQRKSGDLSLERIVKLGSLPFGTSALRQKVELYELSTRLGGGLLAYPDLEAAHFRAISSLPLEPGQTLLAQAQAERWTTRQLESAVAASKLAGSPDANRQLLLDLHRAMASMRRLADEKAGLVADMNLAGLPQEHSQPVAAALDALSKALDGLHGFLDSQAKPGKKA
ncbi:MAG TPA: hypothetical protein VGK67_41565 [Myxococcales bacterium]|jgi:hypothetical protein